ncbi:MAG TPA: hypothetical protein VH969_08755 [Actinophytocola sp.]|jgi:hypothetical protein|uniref:alpha/beta hydrolase family protein n=1 Tax=Actinophytocola sp. TaxID=1872138 RepID=UPI002F930A44
MARFAGALRSHNKVLADGFFRDRSLDFQTRGLLGRAVHGASDPGEVLATIGRVRWRRDWFREWSATAEATETGAAAAREDGRRISAASGYLRAATYWAAALDGVDSLGDLSALLPTFRRHRHCWDAFVDCSAGAYVRVPVPYEDTTLPGYLLRPDDSGRARPTFVVTNGSDGSLADLWSSGVAAALERGWNAFVFDGPGQQSMLFEHDVPFRPDWEAVLTPVLDALVAREDVDADGLTGYGISQGGFWLPRALVFEYRLRAAVVDPGVVDVSESWLRHLPAGLVGRLKSGDREGFLKRMRVAGYVPGLRRTLAFRGRPYRQDNLYDLFRTVLSYRLGEEEAAAIRTPLLITDPEDESFWPGQSRRLARLVMDTELVSFAAADGANAHCEPLARLRVEQRMFDWLEDRLG